MRRFAELSGFEGDDADWQEEYQMSLDVSTKLPNSVYFGGKMWKGQSDSTKYLDSLGLGSM